MRKNLKLVINSLFDQIGEILKVVEKTHFIK